LDYDSVFIKWCEDLNDFYHEAMIIDDEEFLNNFYHNFMIIGDYQEFIIYFDYKIIIILD